MLGFGLIFLRVSFGMAGNKLPQELAAAKKAGLLTEPNDLRRVTAVPREDNAVSDYRAAFAFLKGQKNSAEFDKAYRNFMIAASTPAEEAEVKSTIERYGEALTCFERAASKKGVDWSRQWEKGPLLEFPEYADMKQGAKMLVAQAVTQAKSGQVDDAIKSLGAAERISQHAGMDPTIIGMLVGDSIESIADSGIYAVLQFRHDAATLDKIHRLLDSLPPAPSLEGSFGGDLVLARLGVQHFDRLVASSEPDNSQFSSFPMSTLMRDQGFQRACEAMLVHHWTQMYLAAHGQEDWKTLKSRMEKVADSEQDDQSMVARVVDILIPDMNSLADARARLVMNRRLLLASIAVLAIREKSGQVPKALPDLGVQSIDPFSLKPLRYKTVGKGFKVYSVGADGVDDGGLTATEDQKSKSKTHDIARAFK